MNYQGKPLSNWLRDLLYQFLGLVGVALLVSAGYKYNVYSQRVRYAKSLEGKIVKADCNGDKRQLTNGAIVWVTGHLASHQPLRMDLSDNTGHIYGHYTDTVLWINQLTKHLSSGRHPRWYVSIDDTLTADGAYLGMMHVDPDILSHGMQGGKQVYEKHFDRCKVFVYVRPNSDISFIARWQDGALRRTAPDAPFAYVLKKDVPPEEVLLLFKREAWLVFKQSLFYLFGLAAVLLLVCWLFSRRRKEEYDEQPNPFPFEIQQHIRRLERFRRFIVFLVFLVSLLLMWGWMHMLGDWQILIHGPIRPRFLLCDIPVDAVFAVFFSFLAGIFLNAWYDVRYKHTVLRSLAEQRPEHITTKWKGKALSTNDVRRLGFLGPLMKHTGFSSNVDYVTSCEDFFYVQGKPKDFSFFELSVKKVTGRGKGSRTDSLFRGLVLKIALLSRSDFSFHVVPEEYADQTLLKPYPLSENGMGKKLQCFCNNVGNMDRLVSSTDMLSIFNNVAKCLRKMPGNIGVFYVLLDGVLYVFAPMMSDCFDQIYLFDVQEGDIERDKLVIDAMCEAGKQLIGLIGRIPTDLKDAEVDEPSKVKLWKRPKWIPQPKSAEALAREAVAAERERVITAERDAKESRRRRRAAIIATVVIVISSIILFAVTGRLQHDQGFARIEDETGIYEGPTEGHITGTEWVGVGRYTFTRDKQKGSVYLGEFSESKFNGLGCLTASSGDGYVGQMADGHPTGYGMRNNAYSLYWGESREGGMGVWYSVANGKYYLASSFGLSVDASCNHWLSDSVVVVLPSADVSHRESGDASLQSGVDASLQSGVDASRQKNDAASLQAARCLQAARKAVILQQSTDSLLRSHFRDYHPYQPQIRPHVVLQQLENLLRKGKSR